MDPVTAVRSGLVGQDNLGFRATTRLANDLVYVSNAWPWCKTRAAQRGVEVCG